MTLFTVTTSGRLVALMLSLCLGVAAATHNSTEDRQFSSREAAAQLLKTADEAGYNLTLADLDLAESDATDEEVAEALPMPVAEKLIGYRRRDDRDRVRDEMIGMIFTGEPTVLGSRRYDVRRRIRPPLRIARPLPSSRVNYPSRVEDEDFKDILKPLPFVPRPTMIKFPFPVMREGYRQVPATVNRNIEELSPRDREDFHSFPRQRFPGRPYNSVTSHDQPIVNNVGPDFGPVTFEEFGPEQDFEHSEPPRITKKPENRMKPLRKPVRPPPNSARVPQRPSGFSNSHFGSFASEVSGVTEGGNFVSKADGPGGCYRYTEDICLDAEDYPYEVILSSLIRDPDRVDTLMAEVKEQSADDLVDGITSAQEEKYDYSHYFGNRRQGTESHAHRDFAQEGGYLCPSEVKYARPKRARNSKGDWKFVVNMEKYTQTIRMEKCMKPGGSCSYVSHHYRATCNQIHNYQRLLSWEKHRGLHMDIYKVPSCCACHIQGYAYVFPPLNKIEQNFLPSDKVETRVPPPGARSKTGSRTERENVRVLPSDAPPYSPINFPNFPRTEDEAVESGRSFGRGPLPASGDSQTTNKGNEEQRIDRRRSTHSEEEETRRRYTAKINYDYHPIIDFFRHGKSFYTEENSKSNTNK